MVQIHRLRINDLTAELKRKHPTRALLFNKYLFPETYETVNTYLQQRSMMHAIKNIMRKTGMSVDVVVTDDLEDEEEALFLSPTAQLAQPPYPLLDLSEYLLSKLPVVNLQFNNDIFDHEHDVDARDPRYFSQRKSKSNNSSSGSVGNSNNSGNSHVNLKIEVEVVQVAPDDDEPDS